MKKTASTTLSNDLNFLYEIGTIRHVQRTWRQFLNADFENLAEHIFRVTWIALIIAKHEKIENTEKIVKLALIHDISESRSVDVHYVSREFATRHEVEAISATLKGTSLEEEFLTLYHEVEERKTIESQIIKDADNLDVDLELVEQEHRGFKMREKLNPMRKHVADTKLYTKTAKDLWKMIQSSDPNDWHWLSTNRFNSGDWKK